MLQSFERRGTMENGESNVELRTLNGGNQSGQGSRDLEQQVYSRQLKIAVNAGDPIDVHISTNGDRGLENSVLQDTGESAETARRQFRLLSDIKFKKQMAPVYRDGKKYSKWETLVLAYQTLGIVYGDLGTSPLYVWPTISLSNPEEKDFLGVMSLIVWTFTLVALVKYVLIVLNADDHGEGGTFALYSLLCQHANVGQEARECYHHQESNRQLSYFSSGSMHSRTCALLEHSKGAQYVLFFVVMLGTCLVIGDGILTPAISVLSAIEGIQSKDGAIHTYVVTWVSATILVLLFLMQQFGTHRVSFIFSPIMLTWFITTPILSVYNIVTHYPGVFKAVSPHYAVMFFSRNQKDGWLALGGVVLCITGAEAMFADLGHFNKRAIQIAFSAIVYPSCLLTYAGETAYLIKHPEDHQNAFFKSIPKVVYWPMFLVAILAAIVASQSLISATFSIVKQAMALGCFPRVKMVHTSPDHEGQVYSPEVNYVVMVLCLAVVLGFRDATQIGNAFGVAVVGVMFISTTLVTLVMLIIWKLPWPLALLFLAVFGLTEGVYFTSVLTKIPQGGWVPFAIATLFLAISLSWNYGRKKKFKYEMEHKLSLDGLGALLSSTEIQRVPGICFFYSDLVFGVPPIITHYVKNVQTLHQVLVFTTIRFLPVKTVLPEERFLVGWFGFKGVYRCVARYGYQDVIDCHGDEFKNQAIGSLKDYLRSDDKWEVSLSEVASENELHSTERSMQESNLGDLAELESAMCHGTMYVVGKITVRTSRTGWLKRFVINKMYGLLRFTCRSEIEELKIPPASYLEVGMLYDI